MEDLNCLMTTTRAVLGLSLSRTWRGEKIRVNTICLSVDPGSNSEIRIRVRRGLTYTVGVIVMRG